LGLQDETPPPRACHNCPRSLEAYFLPIRFIQRRRPKDARKKPCKPWLSIALAGSAAPLGKSRFTSFSSGPENGIRAAEVVTATGELVIDGHYEEVLHGFHTLFEEELAGEAFAWILQAYRDHLEQFRQETQARPESEAFKRLYDAMTELY